MKKKYMSFFHAKDVKSALLPITLISWFVGMGVIEYPIGHRRTILSLLYSSLLCTFHVICTILSNLNGIQVNLKVDSRLVNVMYGAFCGLSVAIVSGVIVVSIVYSKKRRRCITELEDINEIMKGIGIVRSYKRILISQIWQFGSQVVMMILIGIFTYLALSQSEEVLRESSIFYRIFYVQYPYFISSVNEMIFCKFIEMITMCFEDLNALLESLRVKHTYDSHNTENNLPQVDVLSQDERKIEILYSVRRMYTRLARVAKHWNQINAMTILTTAVSSTCTFVFCIYRMYVVLTIVGIQSVKDKYFLESCFVTILFSYKLFMVVRSAVSLTTEARRTCGIALHLYPITSLRSEVRTFSTQLIQNPLHLTLHGLCSLDYSMLQQIFVAVATYSVMIVQSMGLPQFSEQ